MPPGNMFVDHDYIYDAFVACTNDEYEWVIRRLRPKLELVENPVRLCVHDRDFIPGKPIHESIVAKMKESRKILLIISLEFLDSTYGPLEIEYAGMKSFEEGRDDVIICVLLEDIPVRQRPRALRNLWHKITFLKWSSDPEA
ncbi:toll-like receptor 2 type-2 [Liolophura sinensis]|uniref:toll-like receptor 2 type-2 n=1 Tax=Liolophura sinensis TaxID=3198878 RepID=UPI003158DDFB